jgi:hypothetical protein
LFSLPRHGQPISVELGFRGKQAVVDAAFARLVMLLRQYRLLFEVEVAA